MKKQNIAGLDTITFVSKSKPNGPCIILLHGYGADAGDLVPLKDYVPVKQEFSWVFPEAPIQLMIGPGYTGRAWFAIDEKAIEEAMMRGTTRDMSQTKPNGYDEAKRKVMELYNFARANHSKVVLGGFSQGAMLATEITMSAEVKPDALLILSGTLINEPEWSQKASSCEGVPFFQSHGTKDAILGYEYAEKLNHFLIENGMFGQLDSFSGGHEIPPTILKKLGSFLENI